LTYFLKISSFPNFTAEKKIVLGAAQCQCGIYQAF